MTTLLLIRFVVLVVVGKVLVLCQPGWPLNATGRLQAQALGRRLAARPIHAIYASPLQRTLETASEIAIHHHLQLQPVNEFGEMRFGRWEGLSFQDLEHREEWKEFNVSRSLRSPPGGERMSEVQTRMVRQLEQLGQK